MKTFEISIKVLESLKKIQNQLKIMQLKYKNEFNKYCFKEYLEKKINNKLFQTDQKFEKT